MSRSTDLISNNKEEYTDLTVSRNERRKKQAATIPPRKTVLCETYNALCGTMIKNVCILRGVPNGILQRNFVLGWDPKKLKPKMELWGKIGFFGFF